MAQYVYTMNRVSKIVPPKRQILKDVSLSFFPGAKIGVLGLNGSGKSTLLKIMAGIDKDIEGEAIPMPGLDVGYLPQEPQLNPENTVRQEVELAMGEVNAARARLEEIYAAYAEPDADFDALSVLLRPEKRDLPVPVVAFLCAVRKALRAQHFIQRAGFERTEENELLTGRQSVDGCHDLVKGLASSAQIFPHIQYNGLCHSYHLQER